MNKIKKYRTYAFVDSDIIDIFVDSFYARLKGIDPDLEYTVDHGTNLTSITFNLDKVKPYYMFQLESAAKIANLSHGNFSTVRRGNKGVVRINH